MEFFWGRRRLKSNPVCKKHRKHKQSAGVCSICLSEKLSQLILSFNGGSSSSITSHDQESFSRRKIVAKSSSISSSCSSLSLSNNSSYLSPCMERRSGKSIWDVIHAQNVLKKSRSMAIVSGRRRKDNCRVDDDDDLIVGGKSTLGSFWSKLLARKDKRLLMHSRTTRETKLNFHS